MKSFFRLWPFCGACTAAVWAQPAPLVISPEVHPDRSVTFRFRAPNAQRVVVDREGAPQLPMQRGPEGVWTATTAPLEPDYYGYSFRADGVELADPSNSGMIKANLQSLSNLVHVPGSSSLPWEMTDVPHGEIHHHFYRSGIVGEQTDYYVYTPPGYNPAGSVRYPVLYLLHGFTDDASAWTAVGRAHVILDNLIAQGRAAPMVIVMPLGYGAPEIVVRGGKGIDDADLRHRNNSRFGDVLLTEVIPQIEAGYRVRSDREARALAGLSMGGEETLFIGLNHLETFAWMCCLSAGRWSDAEATLYSGLDPSANDRIRLLWIACGKEDGFLASNRSFLAWLAAKNIRHVGVETPGGHDWLVWRRNLIAFAPLLFRNK